MSAEEREDLPVLVHIEHCVDCRQHTWCTYHSEETYQIKVQEVTRALKAECPGAKIITNPGPRKSLRSRAAASQSQLATPAAPYDAPPKPERYPRLGSFEVTLRDGTVLFSKLQSRRWPNTARVAARLRAWLNGEEIGPPTPASVPPRRKSTASTPSRSRSRGAGGFSSRPVSAMAGGGSRTASSASLSSRRSPFRPSTASSPPSNGREPRWADDSSPRTSPTAAAASSHDGADSPTERVGSGSAPTTPVALTPTAAGGRPSFGSNTPTIDSPLDLALDFQKNPGAYAQVFRSVSDSGLGARAPIGAFYNAVEAYGVQRGLPALGSVLLSSLGLTLAMLREQGLQSHGVEWDVVKDRFETLAREANEVIPAPPAAGPDEPAAPAPAPVSQPSESAPRTPSGGGSNGVDATEPSSSPSPVATVDAVKLFFDHYTDFKRAFTSVSDNGEGLQAPVEAVYESVNTLGDNLGLPSLGTHFLLMLGLDYRHVLAENLLQHRVEWSVVEQHMAQLYRRGVDEGEYEPIDMPFRVEGSDDDSGEDGKGPHETAGEEKHEEGSEVGGGGAGAGAGRGGVEIHSEGTGNAAGSGHPSSARVDTEPSGGRAKTSNPRLQSEAKLGDETPVSATEYSPVAAASDADAMEDVDATADSEQVRCKRAAVFVRDHVVEVKSVFMVVSSDNATAPVGALYDKVEDYGSARGYPALASDLYAALGLSIDHLRETNQGDMLVQWSALIDHILELANDDDASGEKDENTSDDDGSPSAPTPASGPAQTLSASPAAAPLQTSTSATEPGPPSAGGESDGASGYSDASFEEDYQDDFEDDEDG